MKRSDSFLLDLSSSKKGFFSILYSCLLYLFYTLQYVTNSPMHHSKVTGISASARQFRHCDVMQAERCFQYLFYEMPFCTKKPESPELIMRCQHFNVLDICFRENSIICSPTAIGMAARNAFQRRIRECRRSQYTEFVPNQNAVNTDVIMRDHTRIRKHAFPNHQNDQMVSSNSDSGRSPSELQFISLFGYLQTQCRRRRVSHNSETTRRNSDTDSTNSMTVNNCSLSEFTEIMSSCEDEIKLRQPKRTKQEFDRTKLDASSRLLQFPETRPEDECLMVRSEFSDIFSIHQKYCFQVSFFKKTRSTVTRCLCEHLNFEQTCGIVCSNLEAFGLHQELKWRDFRGRLNGSEFIRTNLSLTIGFVLITLLFVI